MKIEGEIKMGESFFWKDKETGVLWANLFSVEAEKYAEEIAKIKNGKPYGPAYSQLRKFYDEVLRYKAKISANERDFEKYIPYVRMIVAKLTYACARKNITPDCLDFFKELIKQISDVKDFYAFADFFEAFMAFYRQYNDK